MFLRTVLYKITMLRLIVSTVSEFGYLVLFSVSLCYTVLYCVVSCDFLTYSATRVISDSLTFSIENRKFFDVCIPGILRRSVLGSSILRLFSCLAF